MWNAHVWVKWNESYPHRNNGTHWDWLEGWDEVRQAWSTMGDWDGCFWVQTSTPEDLEKFVWGKLRAKGWVAETRSIWARSAWEA